MHTRITLGLLLALTATPVMAVEPSPAKLSPSPAATPAKVSEAAKPEKVAVTHPGDHQGVAKDTHQAVAAKAPETAAVKPPATTVSNPAKQ